MSFSLFISLFSLSLERKRENGRYKRRGCVSNALGFFTAREKKERSEEENEKVKKRKKKEKKHTSCQSGGFSNLPRLGLSFPPSTFSAVDLPIPFVPTSPSTCPGRGTGSLWSLNEFGPYRWVHSRSRFFGRLMIMIASKGHFLTQMPQPMQSSSEIQASLEEAETSMQSFPDVLFFLVWVKRFLKVRRERRRPSLSLLSLLLRSSLISSHSPTLTTGQLFLHSWRHFFGLHLYVSRGGGGGKRMKKGRN